MAADWPVPMRGVTESVVTTRGPNGRWNVAALGLDATGDAGADADPEPVTARTWGRTRTARNFEREGEGYVHFLRDPELFVEAALGILEREDPVLDEAAAWTRVVVDPTGVGETGGTTWRDWTLEPVETVIRREDVPTIRRGFAAVVEATVAASRLDVESYDREELTNRLSYLESVVERCGDASEQAAFDRLVELSAWDP